MTTSTKTEVTVGLNDAGSAWLVQYVSCDVLDTRRARHAFERGRFASWQDAVAAVRAAIPDAEIEVLDENGDLIDTL